MKCTFKVKIFIGLINFCLQSQASSISQLPPIGPKTKESLKKLKREAIKDAYNIEAWKSHYENLPPLGDSHSSHRYAALRWLTESFSQLKSGICPRTFNNWIYSSKKLKD
jgi:hypothetical protein